jgi:DNA-binding IclR family transcriptional regulator
MLTPIQADVLQHLVRIYPTSHNARDVSRHLGMDIPTAVLCLQALRRLSYARYRPGSDSLRAGPEDAEHLPTDEGRVYLRTNP